MTLWDHEHLDDEDTIIAPFSLMDWTEHVKPLPSVLKCELSNIGTMETIAKYLDLPIQDCHTNQGGSFPTSTPITSQLPLCQLSLSRPVRGFLALGRHTP